jgi:rSAM/selenodomain-associated transferase 2/rSAM/selenodomain-associated transferase 1
MTAPFVSIVIPVLDDAAALAGLLSALEVCPDVEIVVVNGGPADPRIEALIASRCDSRCLASAPGRGRQMNVGASSARGRWLVFLPADSRLAPEWLDELRRADDDSRIVGGSFRFQLDSSAYQARLIERGVRLRVRWLGLAYGDQALFVRRDAFQAIGGYREWPLMEDVDLIRRIRRIGRLYHSALPAITAARRWERDGWWRRSAGNVLLQLLFFAGVSPAWLAPRYLRRAGSRPTHQAVVVMARAPSDDRGKTRLTSDLRGDRVELRQAILLDTLDVVAEIRGADRFIAVEPVKACVEVESLIDGAATVFPQHGDTLGNRMRNALADLFARGYSSVVMVGSDLPTLPAAYVEEAFTRLCENTNAAVIGPAADGGYYLIGLRSLSPELFESIPWSTPQVLAATLEAAEQHGISVSLLPTWYDVDGLGDLQRVMRERAGARRTRAWITAHEEIGQLLDAPGR